MTSLCRKLKRLLQPCTEIAPILNTLCRVFTSKCGFFCPRKVGFYFRCIHNEAELILKSAIFRLQNKKKTVIEMNRVLQCIKTLNLFVLVLGYVHTSRELCS